ncbi:trehalose-phosphatase [Stakelama pacifica]|uniref:Trehalose 6-phosphate phosphatase n=1 Tax=Stakelama pacifica TaxID=517720 RepID=A0A4R6FG40_9SPHN|nr:trehalose-phosphatase [Stakelama pacifica]TDN80296.1 trehalose 6-phosphate phosphatase [Stakelama pacifica]GGO97903.1 trehalose 6-phosphate phosphatase [Stakelama pacifica]
MNQIASDVSPSTNIGIPEMPPPSLLRDASLFLDFDGTLVEIASRPDGVSVDDRLRRLITRLGERLDGRMAVVSGRPADTITHYLGEGFAISGSHGLEMRWADGRRDAPDRPHGLVEAMAEMRRFADGHDGILIEEKPFGVGLHYREASSAAAEAAARDISERLARETGMQLQSGKKVFELRAAGADKGQAIAAFLQSAPFAGHKPLFLGDDDTDEHGFVVVRDLGGAGILVGDPRETAARYRLGGVSDVLEWLETAVEAL